MDAEARGGVNGHRAGGETGGLAAPHLRVMIRGGKSPQREYWGCCGCWQVWTSLGTRHTHCPHPSVPGGQGLEWGLWCNCMTIARGQLA